MGTRASGAPSLVLLVERFGLCTLACPGSSLALSALGCALLTKHWMVLDFFCIFVRVYVSRRVCPDLAHPCMCCVWDMAS